MGGGRWGERGHVRHLKWVPGVGFLEGYGGDGGSWGRGELLEHGELRGLGIRAQGEAAWWGGREACVAAVGERKSCCDDCSHCRAGFLEEGYFSGL